uniref:Uncharacterized protein n=1 Tax=Oryza glumipatula TaxID=40148 RepID=A0A0D9YCI4_9ORYZ
MRGWSGGTGELAEGGRRVRRQAAATTGLRRGGGVEATRHGRGLAAAAGRSRVSDYISQIIIKAMYHSQY